MKSNKYVLKALDAYPYNLEEASESLEYALSYDSEDTTALCLMGRMHGEIFNDFEASKITILRHWRSMYMPLRSTRTISMC